MSQNRLTANSLGTSPRFCAREQPLAFATESLVRGWREGRCRLAGARNHDAVEALGVGAFTAVAAAHGALL